MHLPPTVHAYFLDAFSDSLHGVFLWGMAIAIIPFGLSWLLKEVPLRTTLAPAAEPDAQRPAATTRTERVRATPADQAPPA